eukprot:COSAG03_NODE_1252_length_4471_cov_2.315416_3_plen_65_part_00
MQYSHNMYPRHGQPSICRFFAGKRSGEKALRMRTNRNGCTLFCVQVRLVCPSMVLQEAPLRFEC